MISLLHPTVRPDQWEAGCQDWFKNCDYPENVEYVLVPEKSRFSESFKPSIPFENHTVKWNTYTSSLVGGFNCAAEASRGDVLILTSDKYFSAPHWDTDLLRVLGRRLNTDAVVWASQTQTAHYGIREPETMVHAIITRIHYKKYGYVFHPDYSNWYADYELQFVAERDNVLIDARDTLKFRKTVDRDEFELAYAKTGEASCAIFNRRKDAGYPNGVRRR